MKVLISSLLLLLIRVQFVNTFHIHGRVVRSVIPRRLWVGHEGGGSKSYPIKVFQNQNISSTPPILSTFTHFNLPTKVLIVTDDCVGPLYLHSTLKYLCQEYPMLEIRSLTLSNGEHHKNIESVMKICDAALDSGLDRHSLFIALGGGVVGDLVGLAASIYLRGVNFVQIPTTLMAMVDSSVGGKTAINRPKGKNMVGTFHNPVGVLIFTDTLNSLPDRIFLSGISEMIKYGLIYDPGYFEFLERNIELLVSRDSAVVASSIERACSIKVQRLFFLLITMLMFYFFHCRLQLSQKTRKTPVVFEQC